MIEWLKGRWDCFRGKHKRALKGTATCPRCGVSRPQKRRKGNPAPTVS